MSYDPEGYWRNAQIQIGGTFAVAKSEKQIILERQGCVFRGQELLDNHEIDPTKDCYCGRKRAK